MMTGWPTEIQGEEIPSSLLALLCPSDLLQSSHLCFLTGEGNMTFKLICLQCVGHLSSED